MTTWRIGLGAVVLALLGAMAVPAAADGDVVSVFESGGISPETSQAVDESAGGRAVLDEHRGTLRMMAVERDGSPVQSFEPGYGVPMSVVAWDLPDGVGVLDRDVIGAILEGGIAMSERSAALRGAHVGDVVHIEGWNGLSTQFIISAIFPDEVLHWAELAISLDTADRIGFERVSRQYFRGDATVAAELQALMGDLPVRITSDPTSVDRSDFVMATIELKERFGEFSFRRLRGDNIDIEDAWVDENIVTVVVPPLGQFRCHRAVVPYVRSVIADLERTGLLAEIDPVDFQLAGGCYNARLIRGGDKGFALSRHSWGIAIDINPSTNRFEGDVTLSDDFGQTFRDWGFAWGANWIVKDGMHFEWTHVSVPEHRSCSLFTAERSGAPGVTWTIVNRATPCL